MSQRALSTLRSVVAAPDFRDAEQGIPDGNSSRSFVLESTALIPIEVKPGSTYVIVVPPTPCVACYTTQYPNPTAGSSGIAAGNTLTAVLFTESNDVFPTWSNPVGPTLHDNPMTQNVDQFRVITSSCELVSVNNAFTQYGTISCCKTDMNMSPQATVQVVSSAPDYTELFSITGCQPLAEDVNTLGNYFEPIKHGVYSVAMCRTGAMGNFPFRSIYDGTGNKGTVHGKSTNINGSYLGLTFQGTPPGWDASYDTHIMKVSVPEGDTIPSQQLILKIWRRIEYTPVMYALLWHISSQGVPRDDKFFSTYAAMERVLPVAVTAKENPDFFDTMLKAIKSGSSVLRMVPGPVGVAANLAYTGAKVARKIRGGNTKKATVKKTRKKPQQRKTRR